MKYSYKIITILILIIVTNVLGLIITNPGKYVEGMVTKQKIDLGNLLCSYYHRLLLSIMKQEDFHLNIFDIIDLQLKLRNIKETPTDLIMYENGDFIRELPLDIPFNTVEDLYFKLKQIGVTLERLQQPQYGDEFTWRVNDSIDEKMHTIMKPFIQQIIDNAFIKTNNIPTVSVPIIHFRCADTPFVRNQDYTLQKHCFFSKALDDIQNKLNKKINNVIILSYINHRSDEKQSNSCIKYVNFLKEYLEKLNYNVDIQSKSSLEDFATIFYAPASISTSSSFSFMSGFFGKGIFISTTNGFYDGENERCIDCSSTIYKGYNLNHKYVNDYYDTDTVLKMLKSCPNS